MNAELSLLREKLGSLDALVRMLELELVDDPTWAEPSDISYLTDEDRVDPDVMSNVEAMAQTNECIAWFGRDMEGFVGLWRGPDERALEEAPVVRLDTEGQYDLVAATVGNYLLVAVDDEDFDGTRHALEAAGFEVAASRDEIWSALESVDSPNEYRHRLYNEARTRHGLAPLEH